MNVCVKTVLGVEPTRGDLVRENIMFEMGSWDGEKTTPIESIQVKQLIYDTIEHYIAENGKEQYLSKHPDYKKSFYKRFDTTDEAVNFLYDTVNGKPGKIKIRSRGAHCLDNESYAYYELSCEGLKQAGYRAIPFRIELYYEDIFSDVKNALAGKGVIKSGLGI